jgi:hypothetical protein
LNRREFTKRFKRRGSEERKVTPNLLMLNLFQQKRSCFLPLLRQFAHTHTRETYRQTDEVIRPDITLLCVIVLSFICVSGVFVIHRCLVEIGRRKWRNPPPSVWRRGAPGVQRPSRSLTLTHAQPRLKWLECLLEICP